MLRYKINYLALLFLVLGLDACQDDAPSISSVAEFDAYVQEEMEDQTPFSTVKQKVFKILQKEKISKHIGKHYNIGI